METETFMERGSGQTKIHAFDPKGVLWLVIYDKTLLVILFTTS